MRSTLADIIPALTNERDARITTTPYGPCVEMDDDGTGEFSRVITDAEAAELISLGVVRDAR